MRMPSAASSSIKIGFLSFDGIHHHHDLVRHLLPFRCYHNDIGIALSSLVNPYQSQLAEIVYLPCHVVRTTDIIVDIRFHHWRRLSDHDGTEQPPRNHLALGDGAIDIPARLDLAEKHGCRCVLETKTVAALEKSAALLRARGRLA